MVTVFLITCDSIEELYSIYIYGVQHTGVILLEERSSIDSHHSEQTCCISYLGQLFICDPSEGIRATCHSL